MTAIATSKRIRRSDSTAADIITAAAGLFRVRGYAGTTVRDIADVVGMSSGNLFHHFGSKEAILLRVVDEGIRQATELIEMQVNMSTDPRGRLAGIIHGHLTALLEGSPETRSIMFYEWRSLTNEGRQALIERRDSYEQMLDLAIAKYEGPRSNVEQRRLTRLLLVGAMNWTAQWYRQGGAMTLQDITAKLMDTYFAAPGSKT